MDYRSPVQRLLPITKWALAYPRSYLKADLAAGLTIGAMLVPQAMAYALLAGLPAEVGLYAATVPVLVYALFGSSRQLAVGPVAIVSLLTATALAPLVETGTIGYMSAAALLAVMVGVIHLVLGAARLGFLVNFLSHSVLVGFTAAAAIIIGFSQAKHILGIQVDRHEHFYQTVIDVASKLGDANPATLTVGIGSMISLLALKRLAPRLPAALTVVVASIVAVNIADLENRGVQVVGSIPDSLPTFGLPQFSGSLIGSLTTTALIITLVGFMESIAVAKTYARRHRYEVDANQELIGLGAANVAAGLFGGYPVTGGFSRTAVNDAAGARTPLASIVTAGVVLVAIAFLTPLLATLPNAALGAIIVVAVVGLIDVAEMRHIATVKRSDLISLSVAFFGTLALGIEIGIAVAVAASMLVVFARMSSPHSAVLGNVEDSGTYRNVKRFPETQTTDGIRIVRIDAPLSFVNATAVKRLLVSEATALVWATRFHQATALSGQAEPTGQPALILDSSGINDIDATGAEMLHEVMSELAEQEVILHLADVKGPVRDVLRRAGLWGELAPCIHASTHEAVKAIVADQPAPSDQRRHGIDERISNTAESPAPDLTLT